MVAAVYTPTVKSDLSGRNSTQGLCKSMAMGEKKIYKLAMECYVVRVSLPLPLAKPWVFIGGMSR